MTKGGSDSSIRDWVRHYYGEVLTASTDLKTNACCAQGEPPPRIAAALRNVHEDVMSTFYGCGYPIPEAVEGRTVMDLGCGTGRDVFVLAQLVGSAGRVIGVDMTEAQLAVARGTLRWHADRFGHAEPNVALHHGLIEDLSFQPDASVDVVVSNCVVNLSPRKDVVLSEVARVLKPGGEFYFADVFCDRRLPEAIAMDPVLHSECLGGAMYGFDFMQLAKATGFADPRTLVSAPITIANNDIRDRVGAARFTSATVRLFKLDGLEARCEDYGQVAVYRTPIPGSGAVFQLDDHHMFELGRPERVCGNTAAMLRDTRFGAHFEVVGDTSVHYGVFDCGPTMGVSAVRWGRRWGGVLLLSAMRRGGRMDRSAFSEIGAEADKEGRKRGRRAVVREIEIWSAARIAGLMGVGVGVGVGIGLAVAGDGKLSLELVAAAFAGAAGGYVGGLLLAFLYNLAAPIVGGIAVELD